MTVKLTVNRNGVTVTEEIEVEDAWRPNPAHRAPSVEPQLSRTVNRPRHDQWKDMDRRTSYQTGCAWHKCPNCESTTGLRKYYSDGHEECWECGFKKAAPDPKAEAQKKAEANRRKAINAQAMVEARARLKAMTAQVK